MKSNQSKKRGLPGLKEARWRAMLTQTDLAKKSGYTRNHIGNLEAGRGNASQRSIEHFAELLNCSSDFLLNGRPEPHSETG